jgi:CxxC motif-containing protein
MTELICIVCPRGCHLTVDETNGYAVSGQGCSRGEAYGKAELQNPVRVLTSSVPISGALYRRCPVKTASAIPKRLIFDAKAALDGIRLQSPVASGQVVVENVCGPGIPIITTRAL